VIVVVAVVVVVVVVVAVRVAVALRLGSQERSRLNVVQGATNLIGGFGRKGSPEELTHQFEDSREAEKATGRTIRLAAALIRSRRDTHGGRRAHGGRRIRRLGDAPTPALRRGQELRV